MSKRLLAVFAVLGLVSSVMGTASGSQDSRTTGRDTKRDYRSPATAPEQQHGEATGHLPAARNNMRLLSRLDLSGGLADSVTDVDAHRGFAYLGTDYAMCPDPNEGPGTGVHVVNVKRPGNPRKVGFIPANARVGEGVHALRVSTRRFDGDLLVFSNESCGTNEHGGITLVDVSNPRDPKVLASEVGDTDANDPEDPTPLPVANDVHSVFAWDAGGKAYAMMTDNEEFLDVDIMDITNPRNPRLIAETGFDDWLDVLNPQLAHEGLVLHHDMWVKKIDGDWFAMVSYWDAGWVLLNVNNPANPRFVEDSDYPTPDPLTGFALPEGNAHQGAWSSNNKFWVGTDEDFASHRIQTLSITTGPNAGEYPAAAVGGGAAPAALEDGVLNGPTVYGGYGCPADLYPPGTTPVPQRSDYNFQLAEGEEAILVLQRGPSGDPSEPQEINDLGGCFPGEKAGEAIDAGWDAVVLVNRHHGDAELDEPYCGSGGYDRPELGPIVTVCTTHEAFHLMFNTEPSYERPYEANHAPEIGAEGERVSSQGVFDGWGYAHLLDAKTLQEIDAYAPPETLDPDFAVNFGDLTAHEVETDKRRGVNLGYFSWYSAGARVTKFGRNGIREVGKYIHRDGNDFWGIDTIKRGKRRPILLLSDRDYGLFVLKYTGPQ